MHYLHKYESLEDFENDYFGDKYFEDWVSITKVPPSGPVKKFTATCDSYYLQLKDGTDSQTKLYFDDGDGMWHSDLVNLYVPNEGLWIIQTTKVSEAITAEYTAQIGSFIKNCTFDEHTLPLYNFTSNYPGIQSGTCLYLDKDIIGDDVPFSYYIIGTESGGTFEPDNVMTVIFEIVKVSNVFNETMTYMMYGEGAEIYIEDNFSATTITNTDYSNSNPCIYIDYDGVEIELYGQLLETASVWSGKEIIITKTGTVTNIRTVELPPPYDEDFYSNSACTVNGKTYYCNYYEEGDGYYWDNVDLETDEWGDGFVVDHEFLTEGENVTVSHRLRLFGYILGTDPPQVGDEIMIMEGMSRTMAMFSTRELNVGDVGLLNFDGDTYPSGATVNTILEYEEGDRLAVNYNKTSEISPIC